MPETSPWWIPHESPGKIGDPEIWIDEAGLDRYARGDAEPDVFVDRRSRGVPGQPGWSWIGAVIHFDCYPGLEPPAVYLIGSRRHSPHNDGRPYYVARWPD